MTEAFSVSCTLLVISAVAFAQSFSTSAALVGMTGGYIGAAAVVGLGVMLVFFIIALMF